MRELPILFNGDMVRAILDGRKTQTRRPIKPQPAYVCGHDNEEVWHADEQGTMQPPYAVGDHLYVRETWRGWFPTDDEGWPIDAWHIRYRADNKGGDFMKWANDPLEDEARDAYEFTHDTRRHQANGAGCGTTALIVLVLAATVIGVIAWIL